jgi:CubicO group peptidase (beta-lactamase class C family)
MMIEMKVLKVEPRGQTLFIALGDRDQRVVLPFVVDPANARAISAALSGEPSDRPTTHDLLHSIVAGFNIAVRRVIVNDIRGGTFYSRIVLQAADGTLTEIDARTSDAVALALRAVAPIYVDEAVLEQAGMDYPWYRFTHESGPTPATDLAAGGKTSEAEMIGALDTLLEQQVEADLFSGAVLVARDGIPLFMKAYGLASKRYSVPNQIDTKFNLGSMNKMFTAVAIAQLAAQGALSFSDPIAMHLPDYPRDVASKVTIHHLLTHTSGLGNFFNEKFEASRSKLRTVDDFIPLFIDQPLAFEPGERWQYSNAGFIVLGAVIQRVSSGQSYFDYVREHVYKPAGMHNTDAYDMDRPIPNLAIGYTRAYVREWPELGPWRSNLFLHTIKGGPAGGGFSTVEDLLKFDQALRGHKLLSPEHTNTVLAGKVDLPGAPGTQYAYGFHDDRTKASRIVGHGGGFPGINGQLDMYLDLGYTVAVLSNYSPPAAHYVAMRLREMLTHA